jgi:glycosyltransferase involved in cell wall biosynthesis
MSEALRITAVSAAYDRSVSGCDALLARYDTLTGWCSALADAGADVQVVQRFSRGGTQRLERTEVTFVADGRPPTPSPWARLDGVVSAVAATRPHLVHVNGLGFPSLVRALRSVLGPPIPIVVQDHAGVRIPSGHGPLDTWRRARWRRGLSSVDAFSFSAEDQAAPWQMARIIGSQRVLAILESSTVLRPTPRAVARARVGLTGQPLVLWVGRLIANKDPLTVIAAFERVVRRSAGARLAMIFQHGTLVERVTRSVGASSLLRDSVTLVGSVPRDAIADWYSAADVFVSGSHAEGSGYALIEAMACGLVPVVTAIPSFAAIAGRCGALWPPADVAACAEALLAVFDRDLSAASLAVRDRFTRELSWPVIAARTVAAYHSLVAERTTKAGRG